MAKPNYSLSLSLYKPSILSRIKEAYLVWVNFAVHIAKSSRYTIGTRIENKFLDLLELAYIAYFSKNNEKLENISKCILILDTLKFLISIAWEGKIIPNKRYEELALKLDEIGKMLGGWRKSFSNPLKKNRLA